MPDRQELNEIVRRVTSSGEGTGPERPGNLGPNEVGRRQRRRTARAFAVFSNTCGIAGLVCCVLALRLARVDRLWLVVAVFLLPWAFVGYRLLRGDD